MTAYGKLYIKDTNGSISQFVPETYITNTEYEGATGSQNGAAGLVPPALAGQQGYFLQGNGTWKNINFDKAIQINGTSPNVDLSLSNYFIFTPPSSSSYNVTFSFTYPASLSPLDCTSFMLLMKSCGSTTIQWPSSAVWSNGIPPMLSISGDDLVTFTTLNGGTSWLGCVASYGA